MSPHFLRLFVAAFVVSLLAATSASAQDYPTKPVHLLVGQPPGAIGDIVIRGVAAAIGPVLKQPIVVENRVGAEGAIAGQACANAVPDGYTLCLMDAWSIALSPAIFKDMPYDSTRDFIPVSYLGSAGGGLWVSTRVPVKSVEELFAYAKANPGKLNFSTFGTASSASVYVEYLKNNRGIVFTGVPYKTALEAFRAVASGEVDVANYPLNAGLNNSRPEEVRLVAITSEERLPSRPEIPTYQEIGVPGAFVWFGLFAPRGTPDAVVKKINAAITEYLVRNDDMRKKFMEGPGLNITSLVGAPPEKFAEFVASQKEFMAKLVQDAKIEKTTR